MISHQPEWVFEGAAFIAGRHATQWLDPVWRLFDAETGVHLYTLSEDERDNILMAFPQYVLEGVAFHASPIDLEGLQQLARFYQRSAKSYFYTVGLAEAAHVRTQLTDHFDDSGSAFWVRMPAPRTQRNGLPHSGVSSGQCYAAGSDALVPCDSPAALAVSTQQDAHRTSFFPMSFSQVAKPGGGTFDRTECVRDNVTGLMWEGKTASGARAGHLTFTHYDDIHLPQVFDGLGYVNPTQAQIDAPANTGGYVQMVNTMGLCGYTDWRLPSVSELNAITDHSITGPSWVPAVSAPWWPNTAASAYWANSSVGAIGHLTWRVGFSSGGAGFSTRAQPNTHVRLVRGAPAAAKTCPSTPTFDRFVVLADEVTDLNTGAVWSRCSVGQTLIPSGCSGSPSLFTHEQALALSQSTPGWRLPSVRELSSINDKQCHYASGISTAIDNSAFPGTAGTAYWSATPYVKDPQSAWHVDFGLSVEGWSDRDTALPVRLVKNGYQTP